MRNLIISALLVGALACPVAYATEEEATQPAAQGQQSMAEPASDVSSEPGKEMKKAKKHKKHKKHAKKHKHSKHKKHAKDEATMSQSDEASTHSHETPAERKIDQETELNNR